MGILFKSTVEQRIKIMFTLSISSGGNACTNCCKLWAFGNIHSCWIFLGWPCRVLWGQAWACAAGEGWATQPESSYHQASLSHQDESVVVRTIMLPTHRIRHSGHLWQWQAQGFGTSKIHLSCSGTSVEQNGLLWHGLVAKDLGTVSSMTDISMEAAQASSHKVRGLHSVSCFPGKPTKRYCIIICIVQ